MKMTKQEITREYLRCFCAGDITGVEPLLASDMRFTGTLHTFYSAREYLDCLRSDPPEKCRYQLLSITENDDSVAVFYEYQKPDRVMQIAQLFKIRDQKIHEIHLVFDGRGLA